VKNLYLSLSGTHNTISIRTHERAPQVFHAKHLNECFSRRLEPGIGVFRHSRAVPSGKDLFIQPDTHVDGIVIGSTVQALSVHQV
jgi:phosphatidylserine decarboxylase